MKRRTLSSLLRIALPVLGTAYYLSVRPRMLWAGTLLDERGRIFPGDDLIPAPNFQATRAVDIDAPPEIVWAWVAQMGRDGSGFYGLDSLTNGGVPSVAYLRKDLAAPQQGAAMDNGYHILALEANELLIYGAFDLPIPPGESMERTTLILLEMLPNGTTRLLIRTRGYTYGLFGVLYNLYYEVADTVHGTAQLRNIKLRAEILNRLQSSAAV
ncbi:MAG: hypothetical protein ABI947_25085 [Chloroflexota bacterium]